MAVAFKLLVLLVVAAANVEAFRVQVPCRAHAVALFRCRVRPLAPLLPSPTALGVAPRGGNDGDGDGSLRSRLASKVSMTLQRLRRYAAGLMTVLVVTLSLGVHGASARAPRRGGGRVREAVPAAQVVTAPSENVEDADAADAADAAAAAGGDVALDIAPARKVRLELSVDDGDRNKRFTQLGYAVTGGTTLLVLLQGDGGGKSKKKRSGAKPAPRRAAPGAGDDDDNSSNLYSPRARAEASAPPARLAKGLRNLSSLPPPDELFGDKDAEEDLFGTAAGTEDEAEGEEDEAPAPPVREAPRSVAGSMAGRLSRARSIAPPTADDEDAVDGNDDDDGDVVAALAPTPVPAPAPAPVPAKKNIFDRIFQKNTSSRPTDLAEVMGIEDASAVFRAVRVVAPSCAWPCLTTLPTPPSQLIRRPRRPSSRGRCRRRWASSTTCAPAASTPTTATRPRTPTRRPRCWWSSGSAPPWRRATWPRPSPTWPTP